MVLLVKKTFPFSLTNTTNQYRFVLVTGATDQVEELYEQYEQNGAKIIQPLASMPWGMKEFIIEDINGHHLLIGQGEKTIQEINEFKVA